MSIRLGMFKLVKVLLVSVTLTMGWVNGSVAASFDCNKASTETEVAICSDPELSALDELASAISNYVGLRIDLQMIPSQTEYISENPIIEKISNHYSAEIEKMMGLLSPKNLTSLKKSINDLNNWKANLFSEDRVLIFKAKDHKLQLQNGIVVFNQVIDQSSDTPIFFNLDSHINRFSIKYDFVDGILIHEVNDARFYSESKYRYQDECWREIGSEWEEFFDSGPVTGVRKISTNLLTGKAIETLYNGSEVVKKFLPSVICLEK